MTRFQRVTYVSTHFRKQILVFRKYAEIINLIIHAIYNSKDIFTLFYLRLFDENLCGNKSKIFVTGVFHWGRLVGNCKFLQGSGNVYRVR